MLLLFFFVITSSWCCSAYNKADMSISIDAAALKKTKMRLALVTSAQERDESLHALAQSVQKIVDRPSWSQSGFAVSPLTVRHINNTAVINAARGYQVALLLLKSGEYIEWRLFDVSAARMIRGGRFLLYEKQLLFHAEGVVDQVMALLTGAKPFFRTRIAYCKEIIEKGGTVRRQLCLIPPYIDPQWVDYDAYVKVLVDNRTVISPRWNKDLYRPMLFYSQVMPSGVLLMSINGKGRRAVVSAVGGMNTQPSFSHDGNEIVYCVAQDGKSTLHKYSITPQGPEEKIFLQNTGNVWCPRLCSNGDIFFCTDGFNKKPQIGWHHAHNASVENITPDAYAVGPDFSDETDMLCYSKQMNGFLQVCLFNPQTRTEKQLTFDKADKHECSFSPCGTLIACSKSPGMISVYDVHTGDSVTITKSGERCLYPAWSWWAHVPL